MVESCFFDSFSTVARLLFNEIMERLLSQADSNWLLSGNSQLSVVPEQYLAGSADSDESALIEEAFTEVNLTQSIFVIGSFRMPLGTSK